MTEKKPALKDIDDLNSQLKVIFLDLEMQLSKIETRFNSVETEFMYGNITEAFYLEKMRRLGEEIAQVRNKLLKIQDVETSSLRM
jgi:hypothetical protein